MTEYDTLDQALDAAACGSDLDRRIEIRPGQMADPNYTHFCCDSRTCDFKELDLRKTKYCTFDQRVQGLKGTDTLQVIDNQRAAARAQFLEDISKQKGWTIFELSVLGSGALMVASGNALLEGVGYGALMGGGVAVLCDIDNNIKLAARIVRYLISPQGYMERYHSNEQITE